MKALHIDRHSLGCRRLLGWTLATMGVLGATTSVADAQIGRVLDQQKINEVYGNFTGTLNNQDWFGVSLASLGDLDRDGTLDIAVGARGDDTGGRETGAVWILFLNPNGTVKSHQKIRNNRGGLGNVLPAGSAFGRSLALLGDLDGDGVQDLAVGADGWASGVPVGGTVWILFLNTNGTVKASQQISAGAGGFTGTLDGLDLFGWAVSCLDDLDGDGVVDLAVGAIGDDDGGPPSSGLVGYGAVWILFLNSNGTVKSHQKISLTQGGFSDILANSDGFGQSLATLGDLDGDGQNELAVGTPNEHEGGSYTGAVRILFLNTNGTVNGHQMISATDGGFNGPLLDRDFFGFSTAAIGDMNSDGVPDLAVGAVDLIGGAEGEGALWNLFLDVDGTVKYHRKISADEGRFTGNLAQGDGFGSSVTYLGDLNGDNVGDLATGAQYDSDNGLPRGAVWILFMDSKIRHTQSVDVLPGGKIVRGL